MIDELKPILPRLFTLLQTCLNDEDPAVSLASINAYMILGTRYYEEVLINETIHSIGFTCLIKTNWKYNSTF